MSIGGIIDARCGCIMRNRFQKLGVGGISTIETALVIPLVIIIVFFIIDTSLYLFTRAVVESAAEDAVSLAAVIPNLDSEGSETADAIRKKAEETVKKKARELPLVTLSMGAEPEKTMQVEFDTTPDEGKSVQETFSQRPLVVKVKYLYTPLFPFFPPIAIESTATGYREPKFNSSMPMAVDCNGIPGGSGEGCACFDDGLHKKVWQGNECVCRPGSGLLSSGSGADAECNCANALWSTWNPDLKKCVCNGCPSPTGTEVGFTFDSSDCSCDCPMNFSPTSTGCSCLWPRYRSGNSCSCYFDIYPWLCTNYNGTVDAAHCKCTCPSGYSACSNNSRCQKCSGGGTVTESCGCDCSSQEGKAYCYYGANGAGCYDKPDCPERASFNQWSCSCQCDESLCPADSPVMTNYTTCECGCPESQGFTRENGQCVKKCDPASANRISYGDSVWDQDCECKDSSYQMCNWITGTCGPACPAGSSYSDCFTCTCDRRGQVLCGTPKTCIANPCKNGQSVDPDTCKCLCNNTCSGANQVLNSDCSCGCASGYNQNSKDGSCVQCDMNAGLIWDPSSNSCVCYALGGWRSCGNATTCYRCGEKKEPDPTKCSSCVCSTGCPANNQQDPVTCACTCAAGYPNKCTGPNAGTCIDECKSSEYFDAAACDCVCKSDAELGACPPKSHRNPVSCGCDCDACPGGTEPDLSNPSACDCKCINSDQLRCNNGLCHEQCEAGKIFNPETCSCDCDTSRLSCAANQEIDMDDCECTCSSSCPSGNIQDASDCSCSCAPSTPIRCGTNGVCYAACDDSKKARDSSASCTCQCRKDLTPCGQFATRNTDTCECECNQCPTGTVAGSNCACQCDVANGFTSLCNNGHCIKECAPNQYFDPSKCACICKTDLEECPTNSTRDINSCSCICNNGYQSCNAGGFHCVPNCENNRIMDPSNCSCLCPSSQPNYCSATKTCSNANCTTEQVYNSVTCRCECIDFPESECDYQGNHVVYDITNCSCACSGIIGEFGGPIVEVYGQKGDGKHPLCRETKPSVCHLDENCYFNFESGVWVIAES